MPRSTLLHWLDRKNNIDADPGLVVFFESPVGVAFLHRVITAAHVIFTKDGTASIHNIVDFLEKSGISAFVASSYSSQRRVSEQLDKNIIDFGEVEKKRLVLQMPIKFITLCEDETFHPEICLVAIEPVSNFILVEKYALDRKTKTWDEAISDALKGLPVEVIQVTSDEGRSLICHALKSLKVHHSPDCFHVIYEIGRGTAGALMSKIRKAEKEHEKAIEKTLKAEQEKEGFDTAEKRPRGRRPDFEKRITQARQEEENAKKDLDQAQSNYETVRDTKAEIGTVYHPYNLKSGEKQDSEAVSRLLSGCFDKINEATTDLSDRCRERVSKARRVVKDMVRTIAFFFRMIDIYIDNMQLSDADKVLMTEYLIPGYYLKIASEKERDIKRKAEILEKSRELLSGIRSLENRYRSGPDCKIEDLEQAALECAQIFQRSSSCVEGRNAQLSLRHQGIHQLSDTHLNALTVMHNYYTKRGNGTTAAERLFGVKPNDLFEFLLDRMDYPARPRKRLKSAA